MNTPPTSLAKGAKKLLVRGVNWLGDAVMTTPALQQLRVARPELEITLLTHEKIADLWLHHPALNRVIRFAPDEGPWAIGRRLRQEGFDAALIFPNSPRSAIECWRAGVPIRIGYARPWRNVFLTKAVPSRPGQVPMRKRSVREIRLLAAGQSGPQQFPETAHQAFEYLYLAAELGAGREPMPPLLRVTPQERDAAAVRLGVSSDASAEAGSSLIGVNPGAEYGPAKRWPVSYFIEVMSRFSRQHPHVRWVLFGGKNDQETCKSIAEAVPGVLNLAGKTTLRELMACFTWCRALLTNDTGPMHVAAALNVPVIVPFGSTSPALTGPAFGAQGWHRILHTTAGCSPCFLRECPIDFRCMKSITPERALMELQAVLKDLRTQKS